MTGGFDPYGLPGSIIGDPEADARAAAIDAVHNAVLRELSDMHATITDGMVCTATAARLVYLSVKAVNNWRFPSCSLPASKRLAFVRRGRSVLYPTIEIARWRVDNCMDVNF